MNTGDEHGGRPLSAGADGDDREIDLRDLVNVLLDSKWLILACTLVALAAGLIYARLETPIYRGDTVLQIEQINRMSVFSELGIPSDSEPVATEIELLRSRSVLQPVVQHLNLDLVIEPVSKGFFDSLIAHAQAQAQSLLGSNGAAGASGSNANNAAPALVVSLFDIPASMVGRQFEILVGEGGLYSLYDSSGSRLLDGRVGEHATVVLGDFGMTLGIVVSELSGPPGTRFQIRRRSLQSAANGLSGQLAIQEVGRGTGIIRITMEGPDPARIRAILDQLASIYVRQNVERRSAGAQQSLEFLTEQLPILKDRLDTAEDAYNRYRADNQAVNLTAEANQLFEQVKNAEIRLAQLELERFELSQRYLDGHPLMITLAEEERQAQEIYGQLNERIGSLPATEQELLRLRRDVEVSSDLYTSLMMTMTELQVAQAGTVGSVRVVDTAAVRESPVRPRRSLIAAMSLMLGFTVGVGGAFGRYMLRSTVQDPDLLESRFGLPVYAVVPHSKMEDAGSRRAKRQRGSRPLLSQEQPQDITVEAIRSLRTSLHFALMDATSRVVMITSPGPGSGKSFLSANLAWLVSDADRRVLLIDADLRRGHLHNYVGSNRKPGLTEVLSGQMPLAAAVTPLREGGHTDLLATGTLPPNPSELLMSPQFGELIKRAKEQYDLVIVDTPPVLAVTDAAVVAPYAGAVFLLVRAGVTGLGEVAPAIKRLRRNGASVTGFVVNDLSRAQGNSSYYYYYQYSSAKS